jgi:hypothetical protein
MGGRCRNDVQGTTYAQALFLDLLSHDFQIFPIPDLQVYKFWMNTTDYNDQKSIYAPAAYLVGLAKKLAEESTNVFLFIYPNAIQTTVVGFEKNSDIKNLAALMDPIVDKMSSYPGINKNRIDRILIPDWRNIAVNAISLTEIGVLAILGIGSSLMTQVAKGKDQKQPIRRHDPGQKMTLGFGTLTMDSRFLGQADIDQPLSKIANWLERSMPADKRDGQLRLHFNTGRGVREKGNGTSVPPTWRKAYIHTIVTGFGGAEASALREWAPNTGAYINEVRQRYIEI